MKPVLGMHLPLLLLFFFFLLLLLLLFPDSLSLMQPPLAGRAERPHSEHRPAAPHYVTLLSPTQPKPNLTSAQNLIQYFVPPGPIIVQNFGEFVYYKECRFRVIFGVCRRRAAPRGASCSEEDMAKENQCFISGLRRLCQIITCTTLT